MNKQEIEKAICVMENLKYLLIDVLGNKNNEKEFDVAIEMLEKQLANGWIPVSERLPEKCGLYIVSVHYSDWICDYGNEDEVHKEPENVVLIANYRKSFNCNHKWILYETDREATINGNEEVVSVFDYWTTYVKAWMPLPKPYEGE